MLTSYALPKRLSFTAASKECLGKMGTPPKNSRKGAKTSGVTTRKVKSSSFEIANDFPLMRKRSKVSRFSSGLYMISFHVKTTSSALNGLPSLQRTPWRSLNVHVFWSGSTDQDS